MQIHQAFFGNKNGSHNLLYSTIQDDTLIGKLKSMTDKPASIDIEYSYLSAYKVSSYYVFCKTIDDFTANRAGMVFSHCLIIELSDIAALNNLAVLFEFFTDKIISNFSSIKSFILDTAINLVLDKPPIYDTLLHYLIHNNKTIIYLGYNDFEKSIIYFWYYLPTSLRERFSFTISGSPNEIEDENYTIVHTPSAFIHKWSNYAMITKIENIDNQTSIHLFLSESNTTNATNFNQFIEDNEIIFDRFATIATVNNCYKRLKELETQSDFKKLRVLVSEINKMLPNIHNGIPLKTKILEEFINSFETATCDDIKTIRNLDLSAFFNGQINIENAAKKWVAKNIQPGSKQPIADISNLLIISFADKKNWCNTIINDNIEMICRALDNTKTTFIWEIWEQNPKFIDAFKAFIPSNTEQYFANTFPVKKAKQWYNDIAKLTLSKKWFSLFALSNIEQYNIEQSIKLQIENDTVDLFNNLLLISNKTNITDFVLISVQIDNSILHNVSGKICADNIGVLSNLDIQNFYWQTVWFESYQFTKDIKKGIKDIKSIFYALLSLALQGKKSKEELLIVTVSTIDNIFTFTDRQAIWASSLPIKIELLNKTSIYVFENWKNIDWNSLETELLGNCKHVIFFNSHIINSRFEVKYKMQFLEKIDLLNQDKTIHIMSNCNIINPLEVDYIAGKIKECKWQKAVEYLYNNSSAIKNSDAVLQECKSMLSIWQRLWLKSGYKITKDDIKRMIDYGNIPRVFDTLDKIEHKGDTYFQLKEEYIQDFSKGKDRKEWSNRLKVYINSIE